MSPHGRTPASRRGYHAVVQANQLLPRNRRCPTSRCFAYCRHSQDPARSFCSSYRAAVTAGRISHNFCETSAPAKNLFTYGVNEFASPLKQSDRGLGSVSENFFDWPILKFPMPIVTDIASPTLRATEVSEIQPPSKHARSPRRCLEKEH